MKTSQIAALALVALSATGMNAFADSVVKLNVPVDGKLEQAVEKTYVVTRTREQVQAEAAVASKAALQRTNVTVFDQYIFDANTPSSNISREAVKAQAASQGNKLIVSEFYAG